MNPVLGGGTRLMLDLEHRISHDIDLFITNPQWIGYISPRLNDDIYDIGVTDYDEASENLKLRFPSGEIDFIVSPPLSNLNPEKTNNSIFPLYPITEVLAKKIFHRGHKLTPRDLFDWWSINNYFNNNSNYKTILKSIINKQKFETIYDDVLPKILSRTFYNHVWDEIVGINKPDLLQAVKWLKTELYSVYLKDYNSKIICKF